MSNNTVAERTLVMSVDVECDGIKNGHKPLAIGAVLYDTKTLAVSATFEGRIANLDGCTEWVEHNVVPAIQCIQQTFSNSQELLKAFSEWYLKHKDDVVVIAHIPHPVETAMFLEMGRLGLIGEGDQPYPLIDVASMLYMFSAENPLSVDEYVKKYHLQLDDGVADRGTHHPLYDAYAALAAYLRMMRIIQPVGDYPTKANSLDKAPTDPTDLARMDAVSRGMYHHWIKGTGM